MTWVAIGVVGAEAEHRALADGHVPRDEDMGREGEGVVVQYRAVLDPDVPVDGHVAHAEHALAGHREARVRVCGYQTAGADVPGGPGGASGGHAGPQGDDEGHRGQ